MTPPLLALEGVCLAGAHPDSLLFDDLNIQIYPGQRLAILGAEASGKSTLMRLMAGLIPATAGRVLLNGQPIDLQTQTKDRPGVLFREPEQHFLTPRVGEEIALTPASRGVTGSKLETRVTEALVWAGLPLDWEDEPLNNLSASQRARVALAALYAAHPRLLLADEPAAHLSEKGETEIADKFRLLADEQGMALLTFTSRLQRAQGFGDTVLLLSAGRLRKFSEKSKSYYNKERKIRR